MHGGMLLKEASRGPRGCLWGSDYTTSAQTKKRQGEKNFCEGSCVFYPKGFIVKRVSQSSACC